MSILTIILIFEHYFVKKFDTLFTPLWAPFLTPQLKQRPIFIFHKKLAIRSMTWKYFKVISTPLIHEFGIFTKKLGFFAYRDL